MGIRKKSVKLFFAILLIGLFLNSSFFVKQVFAARQDGESCNPDNNDCATGLLCKYPTGGGATAYCGKGVANTGKLADGLMCDSPAQCLGGYCEKYSGDSVSKVCGDHASPYLNTTVPTIKAASDKFTYKLLESFPGFFTQGQSAPDFPTLILAIYKFGIWTIGIASLFMITIGGAMYMMSAGNSSKASSAKDIIYDSLIGIVAAMGAYLFLYVINPDLTVLNFSSLTKVNVDQFAVPVASTSSGNCNPVTKIDSLCAVATLKGFIINQGDPNIDPDKWALQASGICNAESGGEPLVGSNGKCSGTPIAWGLFQINLNAHCNGAFDKKWRLSAGMEDGGCKLSNGSIFNKCKIDAQDGTKNITTAWNMYKAAGYSWSPTWEANTLWCHFAKGSANK